MIAAMNSGMAFDRFATLQLAGDLLGGDDFGPRIATGFHRNTLINQEGGIDVEQFRVDSILDRVNTTGTVFLGLTVGCAQCHDHKYDPISQREYYELYAFFNNVDEPQLEIAAPRELDARRKVAPRSTSCIGSLRGSFLIWRSVRGAGRRRSLLNSLRRRMRTFGWRLTRRGRSDRRRSGVRSWS